MEDHSLYFAKCSKGLVLVNQKKIPSGGITHTVDDDDDDDDDDFIL
jgi:hypothetical protein